MPNVQTMTPLREIVDELLFWYVAWPRCWPRKEHWLAELVVRLVEEKAELLESMCLQANRISQCITWRHNHFNDALCDLNITPKQFGEIKRRLDEKG